MLAALAAVAILPYSLALNPALAARLPVPFAVLAIGSAVQSAVLLFVLSWLGLRMGQALGLGSPLASALVYGQRPIPVSGRGLSVAVVAGLASGAAIMGLDWLLRPYMPAVAQSGGLDIALWKRLLASFYGGITEELLLRLFLMTLIAWLVWRLGFRGHPPTSPLLWTAIIASAVLFGLGHLPAVAGIWPLTAVVVFRTVVLNALGGLVFGWLYWRRGLEYAMLAHFCADIALHGVGGS